MPRAASPSAAKRESAITVLRQDHKRVQKLFADFQKAQAAAEQERAHEIAQLALALLEAHAAGEEELFYPALRARAADEGQGLVDEAEVEHQTAKMLIAQLRSMEGGDPKYAATFKVLSEYVLHHVREEEGKIFKEARKAKLDMASLGEQLEARRRELTQGLDLEPAGGEQKKPRTRPSAKKKTSGKKTTGRKSAPSRS